MSSTFDSGVVRVWATLVGWALFAGYLLVSAGLVALGGVDLATPYGVGHLLGYLTAAAIVPLAVAFVVRCFAKRAFWPVCGALAVLMLGARVTAVARAGQSAERVSAKLEAVREIAQQAAEAGDDELARSRVAKLLGELEAEANRAGGEPGTEMVRCSARVIMHQTETGASLRRAADALSHGAVLDVSNVWGPRGIRERSRLVEAYRDAARRQRAAFEDAEGEARSCLESHRVPASAQRTFLTAMRGDPTKRDDVAELFALYERYAGALLTQIDLLGRELGRVRFDEETERVVFDAPESAARWDEGIVRLQLLERRQNELAMRLRGEGLLL